jgi:hypothetical protein
MVAQMETESVLVHTLWLFGAALASACVAFGIVVWMIARRGHPKLAGY